MNAGSKSPPPVPPWNTNRAPPWKALTASFGTLALLGVLLFLPLFIWFFCRIEPKQDQIAILIHKTGEQLQPDEIQGIQEAVLPEGRYFKNPYSWGWKYAKVVDIPAGRLGVQTRLYGRDLPPGEVVAKEGTKGIVAEVFRPARQPARLRREDPRRHHHPAGPCRRGDAADRARRAGA
jgi:hypothetical protein